MFTSIQRGIKVFGMMVLMLCCGLAAYPQQFFKLAGKKKRVSVKFDFVRNMIVVHLKINNKGPYNFILDTGVGLMIITDPTLVDSLQIKYKRLITVTGMGEGKDFEAYITPGLQVAFNGIKCESLAAAILKKDEFGLSNYAGIPIHGLLGFEFFNSFAIRINFSDSTLTVGAPKNIRKFKKGITLPLSIEDRKPYVVTGVRIGDQQQLTEDKLILDLGAGHPVSLENLIGEVNAMPGKCIAANLGISLTGPINGFLSRIQAIEIGKYQLKNVIASIPEIDTDKTKLLTIKRDGNLGMQILDRFNLIIDYQSNLLCLKPNSNFKNPFENDMSGLEYYADGPNLKHIIISSVEYGSAGDKIGLKKGYEIMAINFQPVYTMTVEQIDNILRSRDNKAVILQIFHDNQYDTRILTLKRRI